MAKKKNKEQDLVDIDLEQAYTRTERFINDNQTIVTVVVVGIALIIGGYFAFSKLYVNPMEQEAQTEIFPAQQLFAIDSFQTALNGGRNLGFLDIIDDYGLTTTGNLANYYAGVCYLNMGEYENAIDYLKSYSGDDPVLKPMAIGSIGDAYAELGDIDEAISYYKKAADASNDDFTGPLMLLKAGLALEKENRLSEAKDMFQQLKRDYPDTPEGKDAEKYIARVSVKS